VPPNNGLQQTRDNGQRLRRIYEMSSLLNPKR
jgi:hypothetical protein